MKRLKSKPRKKLNKINDWHEENYYSLSKDEILELNKATDEVFILTNKTIKHIFDKKRFAELNISANLIPIIKNSWMKNDKSIITQFDFLFDGTNIPKLCEINAECYSNILETASIQKSWKNEKFPNNNQFNIIKENLLKRFVSFKKVINSDILYFTGAYDINSYNSLSYIKKIAEEADIKTQEVLLNSIELTDKKILFKKKEIKFLFKFSPLEWINDALFKADNINWIEPAWTNILASKAFLAIMYELFPNNQYLLPTFIAANKLPSYVKKPFNGRNGSNISIHHNSKIISTGGPYTSNNFIYQKYCQINQFDSFTPIIKTFVINDEFSGIGIRESQYIIIDNLSHFIPHIIES